MSQIRRMGYLLILIIGTALLTAMVWKPAPPRRFAGLPGSQVPLCVTSLTGHDYDIGDQTRKILASSAILSRTYGTGANAIDFVMISGTGRDSLHDPRLCLTGAGWTLVNDHSEPLPGTNIAAHSCRATGIPGQSGQDVLYFYVEHGRVIDSPTEIRAAMLANALIGRQTPVYFLRFMQPLSADPVAAAASHVRLQKFAAQMWTALGPKLQNSTS